MSRIPCSYPLQETAQCLCKPNVEGAACDTCQPGKFNLQETNPDGCTDCFCFGKTTFCQSHDGLRTREASCPRMGRHDCFLNSVSTELSFRPQITNMQSWSITSFKIGKTVAEVPVSGNDLQNYNGEIAAFFEDYPNVDLGTTSIYFKAPKQYLRSQIFSYGRRLKYTFIYSGYEFDGNSSSVLGGELVLRNLGCRRCSEASRRPPHWCRCQLAVSLGKQGCSQHPDKSIRSPRTLLLGSAFGGANRQGETNGGPQQPQRRLHQGQLRRRRECTVQVRRLRG